MPDIKDCKIEDERIVALFASRSGHGKSVAAASFPRPYHQFAFDQRYLGIVSACKPPVGTGFLDPEGISYTQLYSYNGYNPFAQKMQEMLHAHSVGRFPFKTIEITTVAQLAHALVVSSHTLQGGQTIGNLRLSGPNDFRFEVDGLRQVIDQLYWLPCHVIVSAHIIEKWGKPIRGPKAGDPYAANEVIGEKISLRDQPGENLLGAFNNVFRFEKDVFNNREEFTVEFSSDIAKNTYGIPPGKFPITNKPFFPFFQELIKKAKDGTLEKPKIQGLQIV